MNANITYNGEFKAYGTVRYDAEIGSICVIELVDMPGEWRVFADEDQVLEIRKITPDGQLIEVRNIGVGHSEIQIQKPGERKATLVIDAVVLPVTDEAGQATIESFPPVTK